MAAVPMASESPTDGIPNYTPSPTANSSCISSGALKDLIEDETYLMMKQSFLRSTGRGRPRTLPLPVTINHRLLVQLHFLKEEEVECTFSDLQEWLCRLEPNLASVSKSRITHHVTSVVKACLQLTEQEVVPFLDKGFNFHGLPDALSSLGLSRLHLLDHAVYTFPPNTSVITNAVIRALEHFQVQENLPMSFVVKWIKRLDPVMVSVPENKLRSKVLSLCKRIRALVKNKKTKDLEHLLCQPFHCPNPAPLSSRLATDNSRLGKECDKLRKANEVLVSKNSEKDLQIAILKDERDDLQHESEQMHRIQDLLDQNVKQNKALIRQLKEKEEELDQKAQSRTYKLNVTLKKEIKAAVEQIEALNTENEDLKDKVQSVKSKLKLAKTKKNNLEKQLDDEKEQTSVLNTENNDLKNEIQSVKNKLKLVQTTKSNLKKQLEGEKERNKALAEEFQSFGDEVDTSLRVEKTNKFKDQVRLAYMDLQGKAEVAASKCSQVVQIVSKHFFGQDYSLKELPSSSTALNFADEAHHISMHQIVDQIKKSDHYTYASDGTSRQKRQYLERHIVLADKTQLSVGFTEIATDDAKTLLEQTLEMLNELSDIYCNSNETVTRDEVFKELLSKMKCLMSDRAAVNKLFNKKLSQYRQEYLGEETPAIHFLYCNAHFLLGMARATDEAVKELEDGFKDQSGKLGRDQDKKFASFSTSSEAAACRLIRTSAECLGPRCDERSGARGEWLRYCEMHNIVPKFVSHRANRFNNLFENAAATLYHHQHMIDFLSKSCSHSNLKLQSVIADAADDRIMSIVGAIAMFNVIVTGSYWQLMNSYVSYGAFPQYVKKLESVLDHLSVHGLESIEGAASVFDDFPVQDEDAKSCVLSQTFRRDLLMPALQKIAEKSHQVLERQLCDFLHGGVFGDEIDQETQEILDTCPLTNLAGERLFGDMDYDQLRRRHASTHHRSTVIMWKHNNTANWLLDKSEEERSKIMNSALKHRKTLRQKHLESVKKVNEEIKARLLDTERKMKEKEIKEAGMKTTILEQIIGDGGVCTTREDLEELFQNNSLDALKTQIRYRKVFMNQKHLRLTGSKQTLFSCLLAQIDRDNGDKPQSDSD